MSFPGWYPPCTEWVGIPYSGGVVSRNTKGHWSYIVLLLFAAGTFVFQLQRAFAEEAAPAKVSDQPAKSSEPKLDDSRKIKTKVAPVYPQLARTMHLAGTVRVVLVITPAGTVKSVKAVGGHPLLVESVTDAVRRWKYESAPQETTTVVEFKFTDEGS